MIWIKSGLLPKLDVAHVLDGIDVVDDVHVVGSNPPGTIIPQGLVAIVDLGVMGRGCSHRSGSPDDGWHNSILGRGAGTFKQVHLDAVGAEDVGDSLGEQAAAVTHVMTHNHGNLVQVLEGFGSGS